MAQQRADHRQAQTGTSTEAGEAVAQVMQPDIIQTGFGADAPPR
jgi:hypothetical protein